MGAGYVFGRPDVRDVQGVIIKPGQRYGDGTRDSAVYLKGVIGTTKDGSVKLAVLLRDDQEIRVFNVGNVPIHSKEIKAGEAHYDDYMRELDRWEHGHPGLNDKDKWHPFLIERDALPEDVMHDFKTRIKITPRADYPQTMRWAVVYEGNSFDGGMTIWGDTIFPYPWVGPGRKRRRTGKASARKRQPAKPAKRGKRSR